MLVLAHRYMRLNVLNQLEFSSILFDTLFGLILFFNLDSLLEVRELSHLIIYLFSTLILIHWWMLFKSADDIYGQEVANSALDILIGIGLLVLLDLLILSARSYNLTHVLIFCLATILLDLIWALIWRYLGRWQTTDHHRIQHMEDDLDGTIAVDSLALGLLLLLYTASHLIHPYATITLFILIYLAYIYLTFSRKLIDIKVF